MNLRKIALAILCMLPFALAAAGPSPAGKFLDFGPAQRFIETDLHIISGGSTIMQNYRSTFPEIENLNTNMGMLMGGGARATFGLRNSFGLTTELNILARNYNLDLTVVGTDRSSLTAVYINSRAYVVNIPLLFTLRLNVAHSVRWNIDLGPYYSYGFAGYQKQRIYLGQINELGQLVGERIDIKSDYFNSGSTFQNKFRRSDWGLHIGTSLDFGPHIRVGGRMQIGLKNTSFTQGIHNPSIHNFDVAAMLGWRF